MEIGCEEMPASWLQGLTSQLALRFTEAAERERLSPEGLRALSAPRRLVLRADLVARQEDREEQVWGPPLKSARDASGGWTNAAVGFAKKVGATPEDLVEGAKDPAKPSEKYLLFVRKVAGRATVDVLPSIVAQTLRALAFPKRMSWDAWLDDGRGAFPFGRPVRWLVLLFGGEVVPFAIRELVGGAPGPVVLESGRETRGHRFLPREHAGRPVAVEGFESLVARLRERNVLLESPEREARIRQGLKTVAGAGSVGEDHGLVSEWIQLVEFPTVVGGHVAAEFRRLPREVLETVLVHHQKSVPVVEDGTVTGFAALTNTDGAAAAEIVRGMERVVVARLRDGSFFWDEDRKRTLDDRIEDLSGVVFHQGLGTYRDKVDRLARLVGSMADEGWIAPADRDAAVRAARLAKADLTTLVVREFPELQGVMGALYLEAAGEPDPAVAKAVRWHYHPISVEEGSTPAGQLSGRDARVFAAVATADKLDTLAGYFGLGLVPTGSSDPYGLRRAAQGAVRAVLEFWGTEAEDRASSVWPNWRSRGTARHPSAPRPKSWPTSRPSSSSGCAISSRAVAFLRMRPRPYSAPKTRARWSILRNAASGSLRCIASAPRPVTTSSNWAWRSSVPRTSSPDRPPARSTRASSWRRPRRASTSPFDGSRRREAATKAASGRSPG